MGEGYDHKTLPYGGRRFITRLYKEALAASTDELPPDENPLLEEVLMRGLKELSEKFGVLPTFWSLKRYAGVQNPPLDIGTIRVDGEILCMSSNWELRDFLEGVIIAHAEEARTTLLVHIILGDDVEVNVPEWEVYRVLAEYRPDLLQPTYADMTLVYEEEPRGHILRDYYGYGCAG